MNSIAPSMIILIATLSPAPGDVDEATCTAFLKEYEAASARIAPVYEQVRIEWKWTDRDGKREACTYARSGPSTRLESTDLMTGRESTLVADPVHSFELGRDPVANAFNTVRQAKPPAAAMRYYVLAIKSRSLPAFAPWRAHLETPLANFLTAKDCTIKAIARVGEPPNRIVRVDWELASADANRRAWYGTFEFLPDAGWVIKSYSFIFSDGFKDPATGQTFDQGHGADIEYQGEHAGVALVHKVTTWRSDKERREGPSYDVTRIVPGPVPKSEFTIESFPIASTPTPAAKP